MKARLRTPPWGEHPRSVRRRIDPDMLLEGFRITHVLDCIADPSKIRAVASLSNHIDEAFPYLNAVLKNIAYNPEAKIITLKEGHRMITIYPHMVTIAKADDEADAVRILEWIRDTVNEVWEQRDSIAPSFETRKAIGPLDIYSLLPRKNCKRCGQPTCFAFGCALITGGRKLTDCPLLAEAEYAAARDRLEELLGTENIMEKAQ